MTGGVRIFIAGTFAGNVSRHVVSIDHIVSFVVWGFGDTSGDIGESDK